MTKPSVPSIENALSDPLLVDWPVATLQKLGRRYSKDTQQSKTPKISLRVAINAGFTADYLAEILPLFFAHRGFDIEIYVGPYGGLQTEILDSGSAFWTFDPDLVVWLPTHRDLRYVPAIDANTEDVKKLADSELESWRAMWARTQIPIIQMTFDPPSTRPLGEGDGLYPGGRLHYIRTVNTAMIEAAPDHVTFIDSEVLAMRSGIDWFDDRLYRLAKQPFAMEALPSIANALAGAATSTLGRSRKAIIVDLDNTLWGGVVGDDGLTGIALGPETPTGESFVAFQKYLKTLTDRGIVLNVCSKNDPKFAREPFEQHSAMVLKLDDIAEFRANFEDKATNIIAIAEALNLGLDAFVFIDDSPVECALVRETLPEVWTIELKGDPSGFPDLLERAASFPVGRLTAEDRRRTASYKALETVQEGMESTTDIDSFLRDLTPQVVIETVRDDTVERISQLIGKTNQFKLNGSTFSPVELRERADNVLALRLKDRLQDYGIVAVAVLENNQDDGALVVRNWVMSCRVFSRRLEYLTRELITEKAAAASLSRIRLQYVESGRNGLVSPLLDQLGFEPDTEQGWYEATLNAPSALPPHFMSRVQADS